MYYCQADEKGLYSDLDAESTGRAPLRPTCSLGLQKFVRCAIIITNFGRHL